MRDRGRLSFDEFEADPSSGELTRHGVPVPIQDLPFRLLCALANKPGSVMSRAELTQALWGSDTHVDATAGLNTAIAKLREALGDDAEDPRFVETVPKRGYRFIGTVTPESVTAPAPAAVPAPASSNRIWFVTAIAA